MLSSQIMQPVFLDSVFLVNPFRVQEPLELNQLKPAPSQHLPVANLLPSIWTGQYPITLLSKCRLISSSQVPTNFFFIVMTTGQELGP
jgi:hypothetical protein